MKTTIIVFSLLCLPLALCQDGPVAGPDTNALALAVTSSNWSWEHAAGGTKRVQQVHFYRSGLAENPTPWTARWSLVGPRVLVLEHTQRGSRQFGKQAVLVFNASFTHFVGFDFNGKSTVEGFRREAVDPERTPPKTKP